MAEQGNVYPLHSLRDDPATMADPEIVGEQMLIGSLLMNVRQALPLLPASFSAEHYLDPFHRDVHEAIVALGDAANGFTVPKAMNCDPEGFKYLAGCLVNGSWMATDAFAHQVTESFHRREVKSIAQRMLDDAHDVSTIKLPATAIMANAMARIDALSMGTQHYGAGRTLNAAMDASLEATERAWKGKVNAGRSTGMPSVDDVLGGLEDGTFVILGGRPGQGKTALAVQWAMNVARACKADGTGGVGMFSLEMSSTALARRILAESARISVVDLKRGKVEGRVGTLSRVRGELADLPFWIEDAGGQNLPAIRQKTRAMVRRFGKMALIVVDHIQIVKPEDADRRNGGTQAVGRISNALRDLSKEFDCPVLCLSQLSRNLMARDDKRPNMSDLRQAGDIEQDADVVMFVHREEQYLPKSAPFQTGGETSAKWQERVRAYDEAMARAKGKAELIFEKVRDGEARMVPLLFDGPTTSFSEVGPTYAPAGQSNLADWSDRYVNDEPPPWAPL